MNNDLREGGMCIVRDDFKNCQNLQSVIVSWMLDFFPVYKPPHILYVYLFQARYLHNVIKLITLAVIATSLAYQFSELLQLPYSSGAYPTMLEQQLYQLGVWEYLRVLLQTSHQELPTILLQ